jgi:hypothetical protein
VVDGSQRLRTMASFKNNSFRLRNLKILKSCNGMTYEKLPKIITRSLNIQMIPIMEIRNCKPDIVKTVFDRINTTSMKLTDTEVRKGSLPGKFFDFIKRLAKNKLFNELCLMTSSAINKGEREELILRFFTYSDCYKRSKHDVKIFLDDYLDAKNLTWDGSSAVYEQESQKYEQEFVNMLAFVQKYFPNGFKKTSKPDKKFPRIRFEAISVGVNLALRTNPNLQPEISKLKFYLEEYKEPIDSSLTRFEILTASHGSNNKGRLQTRVEYVRNILLQDID